MTQESRQPPSGKRRTVKDLVQFVKTRTDGVANYALLLGAGASATSDIRTAGRLIDEWRQEIYLSLCKDPLEPYEVKKAKDWLWHHESHWYSPQREYSCLFEKKFDLPRQRRMFVEQEVDGKSPSLGYAYLIRLIEKRYFNATFTTNFDDLLNEAFHRFSNDRPIVCAHDSSISSITVTSKRPKIIKVHGDYLFDDIKSTQRETESLEENTKRKLLEFSKDHGLIVVGYSGHDRSVMDVLQHLLKQDEYLKHGIYWCLREGETLSEELLKLLWRERAYWVSISGFDELMAELYEGCIGDALPINTAVFSDKPKNIVRSFCEAKHLKDSQSTVIQKHLSQLSAELAREALVESLRPLTKDHGEKSTGEIGLSDSDLVKFLSIQRLVHDREFSQAKMRIAEELAGSPGVELRVQLLELRERFERLTNDRTAAIATIEELQQIDPKSANYLIKRATIDNVPSSRMSWIERAIKQDPYYSSAYRVRAEFRTDQWRAAPVGDEATAIADIQRDLETSIQLNPSINNESWSTLFEFLIEAKPANAQRDEALEEILGQLSVMDAMNPNYLLMLARHAAKGKAATSKQQEVLQKIDFAIAEQPRDLKRTLEFVRAQALYEFKRKQELISEVERLAAAPHWGSNADRLRFQAKVLAQVGGKLAEAITILKASPLHLTDAGLAAMLVQYLAYLNRFSEAHGILDAPTQSFSFERRQTLRANLYEGEKSFEKALSIYAQLRRDAPFPFTYAEQESHLQLKAGRPQEAERIAREALQAMNFSPRKEVLIINLELAVQRQGRKPDGIRLGRLADQEGSPALCARILLEDRKRAETLLASELEENALNAYVMNEWAIFDAPSNRTWFEQKLKNLGRHDQVEEFRSRGARA